MSAYPMSTVMSACHQTSCLKCGTYSTHHNPKQTQQHHPHTPTRHTSQHGPSPSNVPTPTQSDDRQSLTLSYALQLCSFLWLAGAVSIINIFVQVSGTIITYFLLLYQFKASQPRIGGPQHLNASSSRFESNISSEIL